MSRTYRNKGKTLESRGGNQRKYGNRWKLEEIKGCRCSYCLSGKLAKNRREIQKANQQLKELGFHKISEGKYFD